MEVSLTIPPSIHELRQVQIVVRCVQQLRLEQSRNYLLVELPLIIRKPDLHNNREGQAIETDFDTLDFSPAFEPASRIWICTFLSKRHSGGDCLKKYTTLTCHLDSCARLFETTRMTAEISYSTSF